MPKACPCLAVVLWLAGSLAAAGELEELLTAVEASAVRPERGVSVENLRLDTGMAVLKLDRGTVFPATTVAGRAVELVFLGDGRLLLAPPDEVEAGQLELFTGLSSLEERITESVLVIASDAAAEALLRRPVATPDAAAARRAGEVFAAWKSSPVRRLLNVDGALLRDAQEDPLYQSYFAGWFQGEELGELLYLVEPDAPEQVTLGQFVPLELSDRDKRKADRRLHREQRRGRLLAVEIEDLGSWDTWISAPLSAGGAPRPGSPGFEPQRYVLEVSLNGRDLELRGRARLELQATTGNTRVVSLKLNPDLVVEEVGEDGGGPLTHFQRGGEVLVLLPRVPAAGETLTLEVGYGGRLVDKLASGVFQLRDTLGWYPHAGEVDRALYDVTLRWPRRLDLVAAGRRTGGGESDGGMRWEHRVLELPTQAFSFEVGQYAISSRQVGHVTVHLALSRYAGGARQKMEERVLDNVAEAMTYFEETFGPYPLDELTVVTAYRPYSQGLLGFVTLSRLMLGEVDWLAAFLGLEDPRTLIAHEVAHQWWGHQVGWSSYRDQWISEAMASYAAVLFARNRLDGADRRRGPTAGWQDALTATLEDGRPVESVGPLVLGERLASSRGGDAYSAIVYKKGAVVVDMLARNFGEKAFLEMLRRAVEVVANRVITTENFFRLLERLSGQDLEAFRRQFVSGTGLPEVYYDYSFEAQAGGKWRISGTARQSSPYHYRYRVVETDDGGLDVARERVDHLAVDSSRLVVPVQVALFDPGLEAENKDRRGDLDPREVGNMVLQGRLWLAGERSEISLEVDHEPKELWLDRDQEVFGRFFNQRRYPKRILFFQCVDLDAAGRPEEAMKSCRQALAAPAFSGPAYADSPDEDERAAEGKDLDGRIQALLTQLHLDAERIAEARAAFLRAEDLLQPRRNPWYRGYLTTLEARLAIREGDFDQAYRLLRKGVVRRQETRATEALLLLAIAARATGHSAELADARERARAQGADVSLLSDS